MAEAHQVQHGFLLGQICTLQEEVEASYWDGLAHERLESTTLLWPAGTRVKVVMVSRFGDCGITTDLTAENGYDARVSPGILLTDNETLETAAKREACHNSHLDWREANNI